MNGIKYVVLRKKKIEKRLKAKKYLVDIIKYEEKE